MGGEPEQMLSRQNLFSGKYLGLGIWGTVGVKVETSVTYEWSGIVTVIGPKETCIGQRGTRSAEQC